MPPKIAYYLWNDIMHPYVEYAKDDEDEYVETHRYFVLLADSPNYPSNPIPRFIRVKPDDIEMVRIGKKHYVIYRAEEDEGNDKLGKIQDTAVELTEN
jgi:hypothetical protein